MEKCGGGYLEKSVQDTTLLATNKLNSSALIPPPEKIKKEIKILQEKLVLDVIYLLRHDTNL